MRIALVQAVPDYDGDELYELSLIRQLAQGIRPEDVQVYYQCAIIGRRDLHLAPDPRTGFEMTLLRMLGFRPGSGLASVVPGAGGGAPMRRAAAAVVAPAPAPGPAPAPAPKGAADWTAMVAGWA